MMSNGQQMVERLVPKRDACPGCGYRARIIRQTAVTSPAGLVGRVLGQVEAGTLVESRAKVTEAWTLCFQCLRRERWGWENGEWKLLQVLDLNFHVPDGMSVHAHELPDARGFPLEGFGGNILGEGPSYEAAAQL